MENQKFDMIELAMFFTLIFAIIFAMIRAATVYKSAEVALFNEYSTRKIISEYEKYNNLIVDQDTQVSNITDIEKLILEAAKNKDKVIIKDNGSTIYEVELLTKVETSKVYSILQDIFKKNKSVKVELIVEGNVIKGVIFNGNS